MYHTICLRQQTYLWQKIYQDYKGLKIYEEWQILIGYQGKKYICDDDDNSDHAAPIGVLTHGSEQKFVSVHVCKVTFKHLPHPSEVSELQDKYVKFPLTMMVVLPPRSRNLDPHINMSENLSPHVSRGSIFSPFQAVLSNFPSPNKKLVGILIFVCQFKISLRSDQQWPPKMLLLAHALRSDQSRRNSADTGSRTPICVSQIFN